MSAFSAAAQDEDGDIIKTLQDRVADLEAQLYAVGAGGVGSPVARQDHPEQHLDMVPEGWKLVPVKPTEDMLNAVAWPGCAATDWEHMLAAAPQPPVVEQPQVEQEPVAWIENIGGGVSYNPYHEAARKLPDGVRFDLYTHPQPKREPLTDEEIYDCLNQARTGLFLEFARAIERAHGIGDEK